MLRELWPESVRYRALPPAGGNVTVTGEHPEVAWKLWSVPFACIVVGETEQPDSVTAVTGPELATVIWIISFTFAVRENVLELPRLFGSPEYAADIVAEDVGVYVIMQ